MFVEFETLYRLLDLPEEADASAVRDRFAARRTRIEGEKESAGSRPERMIAAKALADLNKQEPEVERLASALETQELIAEANAATEEGKAAKAGRAIKKAREAAAKAGLRALDEAVGEAEDSLADSGLVRDTALDSEIEALAVELAGIESTLQIATNAGGEVPKETPATLATLDGKRTALLARVTARKDEETRTILEDMGEKLAACRTAYEKWVTDHARNDAIAALKAARTEAESAFPKATLAGADSSILKKTLAELDAVLAEATPPAVEGDATYQSEKDALKAHADAIRAEIEERGKPPPLPKPPPAESAPVEKSGDPEPAPVEPPKATKKEPEKTPSPVPPQLPDTALDATVAFIPPAAAAAAAGPMAVRKFTLTGPKDARCHVVSGTTVVFGRSRDTDVAVRAYHPSNQAEANRVTRAISRAHFSIFLDEGVPTLADGKKNDDGSWQRSVNGTYLDADTEAEKVPISHAGPHKFHVTREVEPAVPPAWKIHLQEKAALSAEAAALCANLPQLPDALLLTRTDGSKHDILVIWRAADLRDLGLTDVDATIIRQGDSFTLCQEGKVMELETGFRVGGAWQVAKMGELTYGD